MQLAKVIGSVVSSVKYETMKGISLRALQPCDENGRDCGEPLVACDPLNCREGDLVLWVAKREASLALPNSQNLNMYPVDATVVGLADMVGHRRI